MSDSEQCSKQLQLDLISNSFLLQLEHIVYMCNDNCVFKLLYDSDLRPFWCKPCGSTMLPLGCSCYRCFRIEVFYTYPAILL